MRDEWVRVHLLWERRRRVPSPCFGSPVPAGGRLPLLAHCQRANDAGRGEPNAPLTGDLPPPPPLHTWNRRYLIDTQVTFFPLQARRSLHAATPPPLHPKKKKEARRSTTTVVRAAHHPASWPPRPRPGPAGSPCRIEWRAALVAQTPGRPQLPTASRIIRRRWPGTLHVQYSTLSLAGPWTRVHRPASLAQAPGYNQSRFRNALSSTRVIASRLFSLILRFLFFLIESPI